MKAEKPIFRLREDNLPELPTGWSWRVTDGGLLGIIFIAEPKSPGAVILVTDLGRGGPQDWWVAGEGTSRKVGPNIKAVLFNAIVKLRMGL